MARTIIGSLILRLRAEGLGEANKVQSRMRDIERAARTLATMPAGNWGIRFQRQLDSLKLAPAQIDQVRQSWNRLHADMKRRNISGALRSSELSHWRTQTLSGLASVKAEHANMLAAVERDAKTHVGRMRTILRPLMVAGGFYTGAYGIGIAGRRGVTASATEERERFRQRAAGIPEADRERIADVAEELSRNYPSVSIATIMERARNAYALMGDVERASQVLEEMTRGEVVLQSSVGVGQAEGTLQRLLRGLDILGVNREGQSGIEDVKRLINAAVRAAQVDPDFDPAGYLSFARRAKVAGPALSMDFLARAPTYMQDLGADATGNTLAMGFKSYLLEAVGSAGGKRYVAERQRLGIRDENGLVDELLYGSDPDIWVQKHLVPALKRDGVDLDNPTAVAAAIGKTSGNTNATAMLTRMVTQREQTERWLRLMGGAMGTDAADEARFGDPFVGWEAFKASMANLSSAVGGMPTITAGLNGFADTINRLQQAIRDGDPLVSKMATTAGVAAGGGLAVMLGKGIYDLATAGTKLSAAAAALNNAAAALRGGAAGAPGSPGQKGKGGLLNLIPHAIAYSWGTDLIKSAFRAAGKDPDSVPSMGENARTLWRIVSTGPASLRPDRAAVPFSPREAENASMRALEAMRREAQAAGDDFEQALNVTAKPNVDTSALDQLLAKAAAAKRALQELGTLAAQAQRSANAGVEARRNFSDSFGAMP